MKIDDFLASLLAKNAEYALTAEDTKSLTEAGVEDFIFRKLMSTKFRKWSISDDVQTQLRQIIHHRVSQNQPLVFTFPFGGYKLWRLPTSPEADWAEVFSISHYLTYLAPIAAVYEPGYQLVFVSDEVIIERMDNLPRAETDAYTRSFQEVLGLFKTQLPPNAVVELKLVRDLYPADEFETELAKLFNPEAVEQVWQAQTADKQARRLVMSGLNIKMNGHQPWHQLTTEEQELKVKTGSVLHDAYIQLPRRVELVKGEGKIILFPLTIPGVVCIPIGSTKTSVTKFWTGMGVLAKKDGGYIEYVLSPHQLQALDEQPAAFTTEPVSVPSFDLQLLKNLGQVRVYSKLPNFSRKTL
jgi:hypothetical protein